MVTVTRSVGAASSVSPHDAVAWPSVASKSRDTADDSATHT